MDEVPPRAFIGLVNLGPRLPGRPGVIEPFSDLRLAPYASHSHFGLFAMMQRKAGTLTLAEPQPPAGGRLIDLEGRGTRQHENVGAAGGDETTFHRFNQRIDEP